MPENKTFKEESQLSEYISILLVAYVQVKLSAVEVSLFLAKITLSYVGKKSLSYMVLLNTDSQTYKECNWHSCWSRQKSCLWGLKKGRLKIWIMGPDEVSIFFVSWTLEVMIVPYCFDKLTLYCIISFHFWSELSLILVNWIIFSVTLFQVQLNWI